MRLTASIACDLRLQWRNGFYYASAMVVVASIIILRLLPDDTIDLILPAFIFQNVVVNSFYFAAGLVLLENGEGTRAVLLVTPQRRGEYIASKAITLGALSVIESLILVFVLRGAGPGMVSLVVGIALASFLLTLLGIALVCPYPSINEFIMPSVLYTFLFALPLLGWFGIGSSVFYDWHPLQGPLHLMGAASRPVGPGRFVFAVVWPLVWVAPAYLWGRRGAPAERARMKMLTLIRALGPIDTRSIARDSMLRWMFVLMPGFALLFRFGVPAATTWLDRRFGFDLVPYYPLVMSSLAGVAPAFVGSVVGFLLLDQRDDQTLPALLVTPMSLGDYVGYRLAVPLVVATALTALMFPLAGVLDYTVTQVLVTSVCAAPIATLYALFIGSFANNKVQGLALGKVLGILGPPAIAAWFIPMPWQLAIGIIPHYWPLKTFWLFEAGSSWAWAFAAAGLAYQAFLLWLLARHFARVVRR